MFPAHRRRTAETKLSDAELQIEALESKLTSLNQLLESEKAAAESAVKASEQTWQARLDAAIAVATAEVRNAAEKMAERVQGDFEQQLAESSATQEVRAKHKYNEIILLFV